MKVKDLWTTRPKLPSPVNLMLQKASERFEFPTEVLAAGKLMDLAFSGEMQARMPALHEALAGGKRELVPVEGGDRLNLLNLVAEITVVPEMASAYVKEQGKKGGIIPAVAIAVAYAAKSMVYMSPPLHQLTLRCPQVIAFFQDAMRRAVEDVDQMRPQSMYLSIEYTRPMRYMRDWKYEPNQAAA